MKNHIKKLKQQKKILIAKIRSEEYSEGCSYLFRHIHIAECLLRGKDLVEIENKTREDNQPKEAFYRCFMEVRDEPEFPSPWEKRAYQSAFPFAKKEDVVAPVAPKTSDRTSEPEPKKRSLLDRVRLLFTAEKAE